MLERPNIDENDLIASIESAWGIKIETLAFLPLGADLNTVVYRVESSAGDAYFVKLRRGEFQPASVAVPNYLYDHGIEHVIPAIATQNGLLWSDFGAFRVIVYRFVAGKNGFEVALSSKQRVELGRVFRQLHESVFPDEIVAGVGREAFSPRFRRQVAGILDGAFSAETTDPITQELTTFLEANRATTLKLINQAEQLAHTLKTEPLEFTLCHADIHGWNLHIEEDGSFYVVDWDTLIFAPKERDLMFVGCGLGGIVNSAEEEQALFYRGYGETKINEAALAYYRFERIVEDIAVDAEFILATTGQGEDRQQALVNLCANYRAGGLIEAAFLSTE